jgi:hypothetical protein
LYIVTRFLLMTHSLFKELIRFVLSLIQSTCHIASLSADVDPHFAISETKHKNGGEGGGGKHSPLSHSIHLMRYVKRSHTHTKFKLQHRRLDVQETRLYTLPLDERNQLHDVVTLPRETNYRYSANRKREPTNCLEVVRRRILIRSSKANRPASMQTLAMQYNPQQCKPPSQHADTRHTI